MATLRHVAETRNKVLHQLIWIRKAWVFHGLANGEVVVTS